MLKGIKNCLTKQVLMSHLNTTWHWGVVNKIPNPEEEKEHNQPLSVGKESFTILVSFLRFMAKISQMPLIALISHITLYYQLCNIALLSLLSASNNQATNPPVGHLASQYYTKHMSISILIFNADGLLIMVTFIVARDFFLWCIVVVLALQPSISPM